MNELQQEHLLQRMKSFHSMDPLPVHGRGAQLIRYVLDILDVYRADHICTDAPEACSWTGDEQCQECALINMLKLLMDYASLEGDRSEDDAREDLSTVLKYTQLVGPGRRSASRRLDELLKNSEPAGSET